MKREFLESLIREEIEALAEGSNLFQNIRAKRARGEAPAKPGDKDYPDEKSWKKATKEESLEEAEGTDKDRMKCNSPRYIRKGEPGYGKKQKVVKGCQDGKESIVRFGDANLEDKSDDPDRKSNFRARHNCDDKKDKLTAGYWSCKEW
tara:strand:- start:284 stop:727 length:444 start_codon:yes stop_codon:yes gene_type:complete